MTVKNKLLVLGLFIFIAISVALYVYDSKICNPEWQQINAALQDLKHPHSVKRIQLLKAFPEDQLNLVSNTITIDNDSIIEAIRTMIIDRNTTTWSRPIAEWNVIMNITMSNGQILRLKVSKISNDQMKEMTHIYFGSKHCKDESPSYSLTLGSYLEAMAGYPTH